MSPAKPLRDQIVGERTLHKARAYDFVELTLQQPDGKTRSKPIVRHRGAAMIVPLIEQPGRSPRIVFVENDRHTVADRLLELPAGGMEPGETPEETAARELIEETGYRATSMYELVKFYTTPGITDELMHAYVATGLFHEGARPEADEAITVRVLSSTEAVDMIDRGLIRDGKTILALLTAHRRGLLSL